jgi:glucan phosphoethanolaminetransferase (alkaline phosphatase superfamily)
MNYRKHMTVFGIIALSGFILFWFMPQFGAAIFLPALGAYLAARKSESDGPSQPSYLIWGVFFVLVAIATGIRFLVPEANFNLDSPASFTILLWVYLGALGLAFPLFGFLAYMQRVSRTVL